MVPMGRESRVEKERIPEWAHYYEDPTTALEAEPWHTGLGFSLAAVESLQANRIPFSVESCRDLMRDVWDVCNQIKGRVEPAPESDLNLSVVRGLISALREGAGANLYTEYKGHQKG